jgi:hypothetical protein
MVGASAPRTSRVVRTPARGVRTPARFPELVPPHDFRSTLPPTRRMSGTIQRRSAVDACSLRLCVTLITDFTLITDLSRFAPRTFIESAASLPTSSHQHLGQVTAHDANRPACPPWRTQRWLRSQLRRGPVGTGIVRALLVAAALTCTDPAESTWRASIRPTDVLRRVLASHDRSRRRWVPGSTAPEAGNDAASRPPVQLHRRPRTWHLISPRDGNAPRLSCSD